jgi:hypothetical protein
MMLKPVLQRAFMLVVIACVLSCYETDYGAPPGLSCDEHYVRCLGTPLGDTRGRIASRCYYCREACNRDGTWPNRTPEGECRYWLYESEPIILEVPDGGVQ